MARYRCRDEKILRKAPRNPEGGWLPPDPKEYEKFVIEFRDEAIRRFGVDEDGDACVLVGVCDNSRQESTVMNYECVPRDIKESPYHPYGDLQWNKRVQDPVTKKWSEPKHTLEEEEVRRNVILENKLWRRRMIMLNYSIAQQQIEQLMREDEYELRKQIEAPQKAREARIKVLEALQEKWDTDVFAYYEGRGYTVDRDKRTMFYPRDAGTPTVYTIGEKPADYDERMKELKKLKKFKLPKEKVF